MLENTIFQQLQNKGNITKAGACSYTNNVHGIRSVNGQIFKKMALP